MRARYKVSLAVALGIGAMFALNAAYQSRIWLFEKLGVTPNKILYII